MKKYFLNFEERVQKKKAVQRRSKGEIKGAGDDKNN
jgi:hypothetical protein